MVYRGKPSKGCQACRDRKTRCDRQTPACGQCTRAQRECPGYRNELDLMFHDENNSVIVKAQTKKKPKAKSSSSQSSGSATITPITTPPGSEKANSEDGTRNSTPDFNTSPLFNKLAVVPPAITPTIRERALAFFNNKSAIWLRNFNMVDFICNQTNTDKHLFASLNAVGLASYAASVRAPEYMEQAWNDYGIALKLTQKALESPTELKKDSTLFSVMALGVFETIAGSGESSLKAWGQHLYGASELIKRRGPEQFRTQAGQNMFAQVASNLMVDSVQNSRPLPLHIIGMRQAISRFVDPRDPGWRISSLIIEFTFIRSSIINQKMTDPRQVFGACMGLDRKFAEIFEQLPPTWHFETLSTTKNPDKVWNGFYHVYPNYWVAQMYNTMRTFRLHLHEMICDSLPLEYSASFSKGEAAMMKGNSQRIIADLQSGILASVPQHTPSDSFGPNDALCGSDLAGNRAYFILWPLYLVGVMDITSNDAEEQKRGEWIYQRFRSITKNYGIRHADVLANCLLKRKADLIWDSRSNTIHHAQRLDPFNWDVEGWAIAHGVILTAQINRE